MKFPRCDHCGQAKRGHHPAGLHGIIWHCKNLACTHGFSLRVRSRAEGAGAR